MKKLWLLLAISWDHSVQAGVGIQFGNLFNLAPISVSVLVMNTRVGGGKDVKICDECCYWYDHLA